MTRRFTPPPPRGGTGSKRSGSSSNFSMAAGRGGRAGGKSSKSGDDKVAAYQGNMAKQIASYRKGSSSTGKKDEKSSSTSAATMAARMMAQKMATRMASRKKGAVNLQNFKGMYLAGMYPGHIDNKGRVYGAGNHVILNIDLKTGNIKTTGFFGRKVGKFNPKSQSSMNLIYRELEKHAIKYQAMTGMSATAPAEFIEEMNNWHDPDSYVDR